MPAPSTVAAVTLSDSMKPASATAHLLFKVVKVCFVVTEKMKAVCLMLIFKSAWEHREEVLLEGFLLHFYDVSNLQITQFKFRGSAG